MLSRRARLLDAPRTSAGPASVRLLRRERTAITRPKAFPFRGRCERSEADEVRKGGSVTRPSRISHIPFSNVRLGGSPRAPCLIPEELLRTAGEGLAPPAVSEGCSIYVDYSAKEEPASVSAVLHPRATSRIIMMRNPAMTPQVPPQLSWSWRRVGLGDELLHHHIEHGPRGKGEEPGHQRLHRPRRQDGEQGGDGLHRPGGPRR